MAGYDAYEPGSGQVYEASLPTDDVVRRSDWTPSDRDCSVDMSKHMNQIVFQKILLLLIDIIAII